ncbi:MAG: hypothetical protein DMG81_08660 [Acidobacteria bacterium]|nr:MAG: hypothetical protein DMG81_08660 [Acidobacteriota bacterium]
MGSSMSTASLSNELRDLYTEESARIQQQFAATGDGRSAVQQRTRLVEAIIQRLWQQIISPEESGPSGFALVALGGFGRGWLFPHSDIDILFLHSHIETEPAYKDSIRRFSQELWDLRMKVSPATRSLSECDRFDPGNVEFTISLLDCRYLLGDRELFHRLHDKVIPKLVMREAQSLVQSLAEVTRSRHAKYGNTVFHLEPNAKDGPGGLRDYNVACWLALISAMDKLRDWPEPRTLLPLSTRKQFEQGRQSIVMGIAGRSRGAANRHARRRGNPYCGLDAHVLRSCARRTSSVRATAGRNSSGMVFTVSPISAMALAPLECRFFGGRWLDLFAAAQRPARSGDAAAHFPLHGHARPSAQHHHRISH